MAKISYYELEINFNFSTEQLTSVVTSSTHVTILPPEYMEEINDTDIALLPESFDYTITIVVYNSVGMSSQPTSRDFGMRIHTINYVFNELYLVVSYVLF